MEVKTYPPPEEGRGLWHGEWRRHVDAFDCGVIATHGRAWRPGTARTSVTPYRLSLMKSGLVPLDVPLEWNYDLHVVTNSSQPWAMLTCLGTSLDAVYLQRRGTEEERAIARDEGRLPSWIEAEAPLAYLLAGEKKVFVHLGDTQILLPRPHAKASSQAIEDCLDFYKACRDRVPIIPGEMELPVPPSNKALRAAREWAATQREIEALLKKERSLRERVLDLSEGCPFRGAGCMAFQCLRKGAVDYERMQKALKVNVEDFRESPTLFWRLSLD